MIVEYYIYDEEGNGLSNGFNDMNEAIEKAKEINGYDVEKVTFENENEEPEEFLVVWENNM